MNVKYIILLSLLLPLTLPAQIKLPPASPDAFWSHQLGFTQIELSYSRPQMRGRKIFGSLVPYGELWRTGAGESTRIKFSEDITIAGLPVKKGQYALYSIPGKEEWTIILNADPTLHGIFGYDDTKDVVRFNVKPQNSPITRESFTIELTDFKPDYSAEIHLAWENTLVKFPVISNADTRIMAQIQDNLISTISENAALLHEGAKYYFLQNKDLNQALNWSVKSESLDEENFLYIFQTTKILEALGQQKDAIKSAIKALPLGKENGFTEEVIWLESKIVAWNSNIQNIKK